MECLDNRGRWTHSQVRERYRRYCEALGLEPGKISIHPHYEQIGNAAAIMWPLIEAMKEGDLAAAQIGIEMMEEDRGLMFGPIVKSNIPRAIAKCALTEQHKERIRKRAVEMLLRKFFPKEFRQYGWLVRRIGLGTWATVLERRADRSDPWVDWYIEYWTSDNPQAPPSAPWGRRQQKA